MLTVSGAHCSHVPLKFSQEPPGRCHTVEVLRTAFWLTALLFIPAGLTLYFLPAKAAALAGIYPLWLARASGGLLLAWGGFQVAAGLYPDAVKVGGLVAGNLLLVATLVPALLRQGGSNIPPQLAMVMMSLCMALTLLSVLVLLVYKGRRPEVKRG